MKIHIIFREHRNADTKMDPWGGRSCQYLCDGGLSFCRGQCSGAKIANLPT